MICAGPQPKRFELPIVFDGAVGKFRRLIQCSPLGTEARRTRIDDHTLFTSVALIRTNVLQRNFVQGQIVACHDSHPSGGLGSNKQCPHGSLDGHLWRHVRERLQVPGIVVPADETIGIGQLNPIFSGTIYNPLVSFIRGSTLDIRHSRGGIAGRQSKAKTILGDRKWN